MKRISLIILLFLAAGFLAQGQKPVLWNTNRLSAIKNDDTYKKLKESQMWNAGSLMDEPDEVLVNKPTKFVNDPRYYVSIGIYWWPDPNNPGGPYIRKDGRVNPETSEYDAPKLSRMVRRLKTFAFAFYLYGDFKYKDAFVSQLHAWFLDPETGMLPNFQYGQIHPGSNNNLGSPAGLIEAYPFNDVLDAIRLVNSESQIDKETMAGMKKWFSDFADWMATSEIGIGEKNAKNNHGIAYDVLLLNIYDFLGRKDDFARISAEFRGNRLEKQIMADGSQPLELTRTRAYHYVLYNLVHIVDFCIIQENRGNNFYQNNKEIIDRAFLWVIPYVGHPEKFEWKENVKAWAKEDIVFCTQLQRLKRLKPKKNTTFDFGAFDADFFRSINTAIQ